MTRSVRLRAGYPHEYIVCIDPEDDGPGWMLVDRLSQDGVQAVLVLVQPRGGGHQLRRRRRRATVPYERPPPTTTAQEEEEQVPGWSAADLAPWLERLEGGAVPTSAAGYTCTRAGAVVRCAPATAAVAAPLHSALCAAAAAGCVRVHGGSDHSSTQALLHVADAADVAALTARSNVSVITDATVLRVLFDARREWEGDRSSGGGDVDDGVDNADDRNDGGRNGGGDDAGATAASGGVVATGVEFSTPGGGGGVEVARLLVGSGIVFLCASVGGVGGGAAANAHAHAAATLLRSGVGPRRALRDAGVPCAVDLPGVGRGLRRQLAVRVAWRLTESGAAAADGGAASSRPLWASRLLAALPQKASSGGGSGGGAEQDDGGDGDNNDDDVCNAGIVCRLPSSDGGAAGDDGPLVRVRAAFERSDGGVSSGGNASRGGAAPLAVIEVVLLEPETVWDVKLVARGDQRPAVEVVTAAAAAGADVSGGCSKRGSLLAARDAVALADGVQLARRLASAEPLRALLGDEAFPGAACASADELSAWAAREATPVGVGTGACCAGTSPAAGAVVSPEDLSVWGVRGVVVASAAVLPSSCGGGVDPSAAVFAAAERVAAPLALLFKGPVVGGAALPEAAAAADDAC